MTTRTRPTKKHQRSCLDDVACERLTAEEERECYERGDVERLITSMIPLARFVVKKLTLPPHITYDEAESEATYALAVSMRYFDPRRGRLTTLVHVSVTRHMWKWISRERKRYSQENTHKKYVQNAHCVRRLNRARLTSLHSEETMNETVASLFTAMKNSLAELGERERDIFAGIYERGETFAQLGTRWGVSKQRIDQIRSQLVDQLKKALRSEETCHFYTKDRVPNLENPSPCLDKKQKMH